MLNQRVLYAHLHTKLSIDFYYWFAPFASIHSIFRFPVFLLSQHMHVFTAKCLLSCNCLQLECGDHEINYNQIWRQNKNKSAQMLLLVQILLFSALYASNSFSNNFLFIEKNEHNMFQVYLISHDVALCLSSSILSLISFNVIQILSISN